MILHDNHNVGSATTIACNMLLAVHSVVEKYFEDVQDKTIHYFFLIKKIKNIMLTLTDLPLFCICICICVWNILYRFPTFFQWKKIIQ